MAGSRFRFGFTIWTEKESEAGEDSPPLLIESNGTVLVGVFDGLGGSGGRRYKLKDQDHTGAFLASRTAATTVGKMFEAGMLEPGRADGDTQQLELPLKKSLQNFAEKFEPSKSRVRSRMRRELPTTMAVASVRPHSSKTSVDAGVWWAGDSRIYALSPETGLAGLTADHLVGGGDAMDNLSGDAAISNCLSADQPFHIDATTYVLPLPVALIAATDGCFGYVPTPMHFENMILGSLSQARNPDDWRDLLRDRIVAVAADDAALSLAVFGARFKEFQQLAVARRKHLHGQWVVPIENTLGKRDSAKKELRLADDVCAETLAASWSEYDRGYGAYLRERDESEVARNHGSEGGGG